MKSPLVFVNEEIDNSILFLENIVKGQFWIIITEICFEMCVKVSLSVYYTYNQIWGRGYCLYSGGTLKAAGILIKINGKIERKRFVVKFENVRRSFSS